MAYFPFFMDITDRTALIVGGGMTAYRKAEILLSFGVRLTVVSPNNTAGFYGLKNTKIIDRCFEDADIEGVFMVVAATDSRETNRRVSILCQKNKIPVNVVDDIELCTFIFPSITKHGDLVCGISSGGNGPVITQYIKETINNSIPDYIGDINWRMGSIRELAKKTIPCQQKRADTIRSVFKLLMNKRNSVSDAEIENIIKKAGDKND